jgi:glycosyltransferase involved in cell wall biosynthesis
MSFPNTPAWAARYFSALVRSADIVVAVSTGLVELLERSGAREVRHIGNGVDYELFATAARTGIPDEMKELSRPVLGYCGAIAPWFDLELLRMVAAAFPDASIALLGPVLSELRGAVGEIEHESGNVRYLGVKAYETLGAYVAAMDVCLIPLERSELMRLADPNKLYEYASVGRPIVSMLFSEEMEALGDLIYLARTREEFVEKVGTALARGADREKLTGFARRHSWQARADEMAALIDSRLGRQNSR